MAASNSERKNISFFKLNGKADKDNTPRFWKVEKAGDKWQTTESFDTVSGILTKASTKKFMWEGAEKTSFHIELSDPAEICAIDMNHTQCTYSIINSLAGIQPGQEITIKVYKKTDKESGKIYPGAIVLDLAGKLMSWHVAPKDMPKSDPVMVNGKQFMKEGKPVWDDTNVKAFWEDVFNTKVAGNVQTRKNTDDDIPYAPATAVAETVPAPDDMPF